MMQWLVANGSTLSICLVLMFLVFLIVRRIVSNKKNGKSNCGCGCSRCPMKDDCHKKED